MPKQKDLKRLVRTRMKKTGESYTTARIQLTRKKTRSTSAATSAASFATLAGISDASIQKKTGRTWAQWVRVLDAIDAARMPHRQIAAHVHATYAIDGWWAQSVTVGYERIRGLRQIGQRRDGTFEISKSRTFPVRAPVLYRAFTNPKLRAQWLGDVVLTVRKATPNKVVRITWPDRTSVEASFTSKGEKSQVSIQHTRLASKDSAAKLKAWWHGRLNTLAGVLSK
jgi:hypothetical protein